MHWYFQALKKYAVFKGRAHRKEFWVFIWFYMAIGIGIYLIPVAMLSFNSNLFYYSDVFLDIHNIKDLCEYFLMIYNLSTITPLLAVTVRRLHDTGRHGYWLLYVLFLPGLFFLLLNNLLGSHQAHVLGGCVALILDIVLLVFLVQNSEPGNNRYGPNPEEM